MTSLRQFLAQEDGATAIEYGLIVALVSLAVLGGLQLLGPALEETFTGIAEEVQGAQAGGGGGGGGDGT
ncbi:MAG: Flp family type IVb pilin [Alphaproteobacteria bacterium]|nr:Flp family type IVb pilin [Alphaproteobacteria bacterium SS10]